MGALIGREHWEKVMSYVCRAEAPLRILTGGDRPKEIKKGTFLSPTVIENVPLEHPISKEEILGLLSRFIHSKTKLKLSKRSIRLSMVFLLRFGLKT